MHPHIADLMVTEHLDRIRAEADRGRLIQGTRGGAGRPSWPARLAATIRRQPARRDVGMATRQG